MNPNAEPSIELDPALDAELDQAVADLRPETKLDRLLLEAERMRQHQKDLMAGVGMLTVVLLGQTALLLAMILS